LEHNKNSQNDKLQKDLEEATTELASYKTKYKAAIARRDTLENQMKDSRNEFNQKMKILIEKTENDDKLI
jgi:hypothetical protein